MQQVHWNIVLHCNTCVRTAQHILGDSADVSLENQSASVYVSTLQEAQELTEQLEDAGLEATLVENNDNNNNNAGFATEDPLQPLPTTTTMSTTGSSSSNPSDMSRSSNNNNNNNNAKVDMIVSGMTCAMCTKAITSALEQVRGVGQVHVSLSTNLAAIEYDPSLVSVSRLRDTIEDTAGYDVTEVLLPETQTAQERMQTMTAQQSREVWHKKAAFFVSLVGTLPIVFITMVLQHSPAMTTKWLHTRVTIYRHEFLLESLILCGLASMVQFGSGFTFYKTASRNIQTGILGMDVLVALGTTASYVYGWVELWDGEEAHVFETCAVLICFVLLGKWMNALAVRRTSQALTQLMQLQAKTAILVHDNDNDEQEEGKEQVVSVDKIHPGDTVKILRGASIPADGVVSEGDMTVDESMITGESVPVLKTTGSLVLGGTVCVESTGTLVCVTGVGSSTALSQIVQLVHDAQTRQVPIQNLADTISSVFVPTVCTLSVLTFMVWYALCNTGVVPADWYQGQGGGGDGKFSLMFGIACLVISCPCALGLATPTAVMVGTGVGAKHGVLMKGGDSLEATSRVNAVVFDKTGTLTKGKPAVTNYLPLQQEQQQKRNNKNNNKWDPEYLLWMLACLERNSEHPLAMAVVRYAEEKIPAYVQERPLVQPQQFQALTGRGASAVVDGNQVAVGNRRYFAESKRIAVSAQVDTCMTKLESQGKTAILAAVNGHVVAVLGIADELKSDAGDALQYLQDTMGVEVWMVTGDNRRAADAIAHQLGLAPTKVISEALPVAKVQQVQKLQNEGKVVAMIGDGINDSPALAQANVGISLGSGAQIATEAADMVLVRGNVADVCTALDLSRVIFRRIQWNFVFSLLYNCLGIPVAAGVFYPVFKTRLPPTLAAVAMALSSLSVVAGSLALRLYRPPQVDNSSSGGLFRNVLRRFSSSGGGGGGGAGEGEETTAAAASLVEEDRQADLEEPLLENDFLPPLDEDIDDVDVDDDDDDKFPALGMNSTSSFSADGLVSVTLRVTPSEASTMYSETDNMSVSQRFQANLLEGIKDILGLQKDPPSPSGQILEYTEAMDDVDDDDDDDDVDDVDDDKEGGNTNGSDYDEMLLQRIEEGQNKK